METTGSLVAAVESVVAAGKVVVTTEGSNTVAMMINALQSGRTATFYVAPAEAHALMRLYWTPQRIRDIGMERVSDEERGRIEDALGVPDMGPWFSNRIECSCGGVYGAFEFIEQGVRQHGKNWVGVIMALKNVSVVRINPVQDAFCPQCRQVLLASHWYGMYAPDGTLIYGCCKGEIPILA